MNNPDSGNEAGKQAWAEAHDHYAERIRALPAPSSPWQPIATAPKDGTMLVLAAGEDYAIARWVPDLGGSWDAGDIVYEPDAFTHWMPLPPAPPAEAGE